MNFISIPINNLPYKKIPGFLKSLKINPDLVAVSISDDGLRYVPMDWKNYLSYDHRVVKIILTKMDNLFLFVGHSKDDKTIFYNNNFSEIILKQETNPRIDQTIFIENNSTYGTKSNMLQINAILDVVGQFGLSALSNDMLEQLKKLSRK